MKKSLIKFSIALFMISLTGFGGCNGKAKAPASDQSATSKTSMETSPGAQSLREELEKQAPFTLDQLKAVIPQELIGAKLSNADAKSNMGAAFASANYSLNDSASIELNIFDCAGTEGAGIYDRQYLELLKSDTPDEATEFSVSDFKGAKSVTQENKKDDINNFTFLAQKRFLIMLEGKFVSIEQLQQAAASINFPK